MYMLLWIYKSGILPLIKGKAACRVVVSVRGLNQVAFGVCQLISQSMVAYATF